MGRCHVVANLSGLEHACRADLVDAVCVGVPCILMMICELVRNKRNLCLSG